jgi:hypothetical protein
MSNDASQSQSNIIDEAPKLQLSIFEFIANNFTSLSTIAVLISALLSLVFLYEYLAVFDGWLIMTIEYSDLIKLIMLGAVVIFLLIGMINGVLYAAIDYYVHFSKIRAIVSLSTPILIPLMLMIVAIFRKSGDWDYYLLWTLSIATLMLLMWRLIVYYRNIANISATTTYGNVVIAAFLAFLVGQTFGIYVRNYGRSHQIFVKQGSTPSPVINDAQLILFTSHHVILKAGRSIIAIPTTEIQEITSSQSFHDHT